MKTHKNGRPRAAWYVIAVLLSIASAVSAYPVEASAVTGRVVDQDGRAIVGAEVQIECPEAGVRATATSDGSGDFSFEHLRAASCGLSAVARGFERKQQNVKLPGGGTAEITIQLRVAGGTEMVEIGASRELVQKTLTVSEVRESPAKDVGEALAHVDGLWKVRKGGIANDVVLRGFQHGNVNVMIDGARIYGACPNSMDPPAYHVDFAEIEQVNVTKGPFDVRNQGGLGGTVDIVNKSPANGLVIRPSLSVGSFGFYNPALTVSRASEKVGFLGGFSYRTSQPYKDGSGRRFTSYTNYKPSALDRSAFDVNTGWFTMEFSPTPNQHASIGYTRQQGGFALYPYLLMDADHDNADRVNVKYELRNIASRLQALRVQAYFTTVKHFMTDAERTSALTGLGAFSMATNASTMAAGGQLEAALSRNLTVGFEMFQRGWDAMNYMRKPTMNMDQNVIPDVGTLITGAYVDYKRNLSESVRMSGGIRLDRVGMTASSSATTDLYYAYQNTRTLNGSDAAPSGNIRLTITGPKKMELFAGIGSAVRFPDAQERYFQQKKMGQDVVGNPLLVPTRNTESTVGVRLRHGSSFLSVEAFYSALTDFITLTNQSRVNMVPGIMNTQSRSYENVDARIYGGETSYALVLPKQVLLSGGMSYSRGIQERKPTAGLLATNMAEMPPLRAWSSLRYTHKVFFAEVSGIGVNRQGRVDSDLKETPTPGYAVMSVQAGVHPGRFYFTVYAENVLNRYYYEHFSSQRDPFRSGVKVPEPGRNVFAALSYTF